MCPKAWLTVSAKEMRLIFLKEEPQIVNPLLITNQENLCNCLIKQTSIQLELQVFLAFYANLITTMKALKS